jgi:hypothetical protein
LTVLLYYHIQLARGALLPISGRLRVTDSDYDPYYGRYSLNNCIGSRDRLLRKGSSPDENGSKHSYALSHPSGRNDHLRIPSSQTEKLYFYL